MSRLVVYIDKTSGSDFSSLLGDIQSAVNSKATHIILAFLVPVVSTRQIAPWDAIGIWTQGIANNIGPVQSLKRLNPNVRIMASFGGEFVALDTLNQPYAWPDATVLAKTIVKFCRDNYLDGIDFDFEASPGENQYFNNKANLDWLVSLNNSTRDEAGDSDFVISHAPQAPYFGMWLNLSSGVNLDAYKTLGYNYIELNSRKDAVDFYNIQYYNQGSGCYTTYESLFIKGRTTGGFSIEGGSAVNEIISHGLNQRKLVVGKYILNNQDANNGFVDATTLGGWFLKAKQDISWNAGFMLWKFYRGTDQISFCSTLGNVISSGYFADYFTPKRIRSQSPDSKGHSTIGGKMIFTASLVVGIIAVLLGGLLLYRCSVNGDKFRWTYLGLVIGGLVLTVVSSMYVGKREKSVDSRPRKPSHHSSCTEDVDCVLSDWGPWSTCVGGSQTRTRTVQTQPTCAGKKCDSLVASQSCSIPSVSVASSNKIAGFPDKIYGMWHCAGDYCVWSTTMDNKNFDPLIGKVNLISLAFANPYTILNPPKAGSSDPRLATIGTDGLPLAMVSAIPYLQRKGIYVMISVGGWTYSGLPVPGVSPESTTSGGHNGAWATAVGQDATALGKAFADIANKYNVGIEIDFERGNDSYKDQLQTCIDTFRANTQLPLSIDLYQGCGWDPIHSNLHQLAGTNITTGKITFANSMVAPNGFSSSNLGQHVTGAQCDPSNPGKWDPDPSKSVPSGQGIPIPAKYLTIGLHSSNEGGTTGYCNNGGGNVNVQGAVALATGKDSTLGKYGTWLGIMYWCAGCCGGVPGICSMIDKCPDYVCNNPCTNPSISNPCQMMKSGSNDFSGLPC